MGNGNTGFGGFDTGAYWRVVTPEQYGAAGDGVTDDSTAITNALNAAIGTGGPALVLFGPKTYVCNDVSTAAQSTGWIAIRGSGKYATTLLGSKAVDHVLSQQMPGEVTDMTIDGGATTTNGLVQTTSGTIAITEMSARRVRCRNISTSGSGWVHVVWDQAQIYQIARTYLEDVVWEGPSATAHDAAAVSYVDTAYVTNHTCLNLYRTPNFYAANHLIIEGISIKTGTTGGVAGFVIDSEVAEATVDGLTYTNGGANLNLQFNTPYLRASNWKVPQDNDSLLDLNLANNSQVAEFTNCDLLSGIQINNTMGRLAVTGGTIHGGAAGDIFRCDTASGPIITTGTTFVNAAASALCYTSAAGTFDLHINGGYAVNINALTNTGTPTGEVVALHGFNPVGAISVTIPASGTALGPYPYNTTHYVTAASGGCTLAIEGGPSPVVPASTLGTVNLPAGKTLTPTYTTAPTAWLAEGD